MEKHLLLIISILTILSCKTAEKSSQEVIDPVEYSMDTNADFLSEYPEINAISIGIFKDGKKLTKYYGEIDKGKNNKPNDNSLFEIASVTKTFTGFLTAQAVLEGKLNLEDDIRKYLNGSYPNLEYQSQPIKIKNLLTHSAGFTRDFSSTLQKFFLDDISESDEKELRTYNKEKLLEDLNNFELNTTPNTTYNYSPIVGPEILAILLENVYQKPYSTLLNEFILKKIGMENTAIHLDENAKKHIVNGYTDKGKLVKPAIEILNGAGGGIKSTIPDLLKYIEYLLESKNPVIKEMKKPLFYDKEDDEDYGYFWRLNDKDILHNGGTGGSANWVIILPESNCGFTVHINSNGDTSGDLINAIAFNIYRDMASYPEKNMHQPVRKAILENTKNGILYYKNLKKNNPSNYNFHDKNVLNNIGYDLLGENRITDAIQVFQLLVTEFPNSANAYDSLGEGYYKNKQYNLSLINYKKSLELNPKSTNPVKMIEKINEILNEE
ncbi:hypothetical protein LPB136_05660 [Tenacibaculum todarodis]|uniref:Beta-lactamase-related domain-containing protein n=1 Tax=Tenacibaculum todarodis TaxID=1850252 RepID=A0A1L3JID1_9FLAO|nr:serine hydrolase [Tenacibaculum todarodis]APG64874.1 hypothetical protein LPB136_05660 [Tenacibaculum todarodis]